MLKLSAKTARHTILHLQGLTRPPSIKQSQKELYQLIEQLGFVQLDSIQWVERAHHMTLFARNQTYRPKHLEPLIERDQLLFENWTHDASFIPSAFYPFWKHKFEREEARLKSKFTQWQGKGFSDHLTSLLSRIEEQGSLMSRDLERTKEKRDMWQWHDGKAALEYLWRTGKLATKARRNFQKVYDLPERCLSVENCNATVSKQEFIDWACRSALERLGFGTPSDIAHYWDLLSIAEVKEWLEKQDDKTVCLIEVKGLQKTTKELFARADIEDITNNLAPLPNRVRALSPFDPVIRDRKRLSWLWGFDYRIEIYVPAAKRKWGYYIFPLLEKDQLIGRVDMKANRAGNSLDVAKIWLEPGIRPSKGRLAKIETEFIRQSRLTSMKSVQWNGRVEN